MANVAIWHATQLEHAGDLAAITERDNANPSCFEEEKNLGLIIGLSVAGGVLVLAAIGVIAYMVTKKKKKQAW